MREVILDIETTGLDYRQNRTIEIGAIELIDKSPTGKKFHKYINPLMRIAEAAYKIHGISNSFLQDKPTFTQIADELVEFLSNSYVVAHNAKFDVGFINNELKLAEKTFLIKNDKTICTAQIASKKFPGSRINLNALCKRLKIDIKHRALHGALIDAELLMRVYMQMTGHQQTDLTTSIVNKKIQQDLPITTKTINKYKTIVPNNTEIQYHNNMIEEIESNMWESLNNYS